MNRQEFMYRLNEVLSSDNNYHHPQPVKTNICVTSALIRVNGVGQNHCFNRLLHDLRCSTLPFI